MSALIGYTGFVGTHLRARGHYTHLFRSSNIDDIRGLRFDLVVCAAPSAVKWKANKEPINSLRSTLKLIDCLATVETDRMVLISTIDVYGSTQVSDSSTNEDTAPIPDCPYGQHHYILEMALTSVFGDKLTVIRLPALFGNGLKKNALYDLLRNNNVDRINPQSTFKLYNVEYLHSDMEAAIASKEMVTNLFPVDATRIADVEPAFEHRATGHSTGCVDYKASSRLYQGSAPFVANVHEWVVRERIRDSIGISPISTVSMLEPDGGVGFPAAVGAGPVGLAPTLWHKWEVDPTVWDAPHFKAMRHMQSISYGIDASICSQTFIDHYARVVEIARRVGTIETITLGSPKNRWSTDSFETVVAHLRRLLDMTPAGTLLCLEGNPKEYGAHWGHTRQSLDHLLEKLPDLQITFDTGCYAMMEPKHDPAESIRHFGDRIGHVHIALPHMAEITAESFDHDVHVIYAKTLREIGYTGQFSIEQKTPPNIDGGRLEHTVAVVRDAYHHFLS